MRKLMTSMAVAIACFGAGQAQKFEFGVQAGGNLSHLVYDVESTPRVGGYTGAFAQYRFGTGPWSLRLGVNWENNNTTLQNLNLGKPIQQIVHYDMTMHHLTVPISVGYTFQTNWCGGLSLTPRVGVFHRWGLSSSGQLTSFLLNRDNSDTPAVASVAPFEGASGEVPRTKHNYTGSYRFEPYTTTTFGLFGGLDVGINKHWEVNVAYKLGAGHGITRNNLKERGAIWLNSFELGASYIF